MGTWYTVENSIGNVSIDFNKTDDGLLIPDSNGVFWTIDFLDGWDGADVRQVSLDLYGNDGIAVGVSELASRLLTLKSGFAFAPSEDARWAAENEYSGLVTATVPGGLCKVTVHQEIDRFIWAYLSSKPEYQDVPRGSIASYFPTQQWPFQFEASLICPNPVKQSVTEESPFELTRNGTVNVPTGGNYPTQPLYIFAFPANGDYIEDGEGNRVTVTSANRGGNASMPNELWINCATHEVTDGDLNPAWDCVSQVAWPQLLQDGLTAIAYHLGSASPRGTQQAYAEWTDSWI